MLPGSAGVVVIGASIAYHPAGRKIRIVLLEKGDPAGGSSAACGGTVFLQTKNSGPNLKLALASANRYQRLAEELAADIEYAKRGGLIIIEKEQERETVEYLVDRQQRSGLDVRLLDQAQARELEPALSPEILGAAFSPRN